MPPNDQCHSAQYICDGIKRKYPTFFETRILLKILDCHDGGDEMHCIACSGYRLYFWIKTKLLIKIVFIFCQNFILIEIFG